MNTYMILLTIHIAGILTWVSGMLSVGVLAAVATGAEAGPGRQRITSAARRLYLMLTKPAMGVTVGAGIALILSNDAGWFRTQGWLHTKITLVLGLIAIDHLLMRRVKRVMRATEGEGVKAPSALLWVMAALALVIVALVELKPM